jgi:NAD+ kinase
VPSADVRRAAVIANARGDGQAEATARVREAARAAEVEIVGNGDDGAADVDLAIVLGGDGTMLRALHRFRGTSTPVIGVNFGRVGFLSSIAPAELESALARVFAGDYSVYELPTLEAEAGGEHAVAANDVVVHGSTLGRMVELEWSVAGEELGRQHCDGVVCATPSGSTAYNLSNGGPVLMWGLEAMVVTFVAPHSLHARALVVPRGREVAVRNRTEGSDVTVLVDGQPLTQLGSGGLVTVRLGDERTLLATLPERSFFRRFREHFAP